MPTLQTEILGKTNTKAIPTDLDMANELQEATTIRIASNQQRLKNLYNKRVRPFTFIVGDKVLRRVFENIADPAIGKFQPNWEGLYMIVKVGAAYS